MPLTRGGQLGVLILGTDLGPLISRLQVAVTVDFDGDPLVARSATIRVDCELTNGESPDELLSMARERSTVANLLERGVDVVFQ